MIEWHNADGGRGGGGRGGMMGRRGDKDLGGGEDDRGGLGAARLLLRHSAV